MRSALFALALIFAASSSAPVRAEGDQADDDERPGERAKKGGAERNEDRNAERAPERAPEPVTDSDTPAQRDPEPPPVTRSTKKLSRDGKNRRGDSALNLNEQAATANPEGSYAGVTLGGEGLPPHPPKLPLKGPQRMTWPGFQVRDGVPTVFLQTTGTPDYAVAATTGAVHVTLRGTKIQLRNNKRPLKVAEFGTSVLEISAKPHGKDVVVTIKTKGESSHRERIEQSAGGFQLLVVELPGK